jgi:predicted nucleic acid-binding protein
MAALVLDASIVLAELLPDETNPRADTAIQILSRGGGLAPAHWPLEVANGLLMAERRKRIDASFRLKCLADVGGLPVALDSETQSFALSSISDLAARYGITVYDAAYLELAARSGLPLATLDDELHDAAKIARVPVLE